MSDLSSDYQVLGESIPNYPPQPQPKAFFTSKGKPSDKTFFLQQLLKNSVGQTFSVPTFEEETDNLKKVTYYVIQIKGAKPIKRRYSQFQWLYNSLKVLLPGVLIPPLPSKKALDGVQKLNLVSLSGGIQQVQKFLGRPQVKRRNWFELFLNACEGQRLIRQSECFMVFCGQKFNQDRSRIDQQVKQLRFEQSYLWAIVSEITKFTFRSQPVIDKDVFSELKLCREQAGHIRRIIQSREDMFVKLAGFQVLHEDRTLTQAGNKALDKLDTTVKSGIKVIETYLCEGRTLWQLVKQRMIDNFQFTIEYLVAFTKLADELADLYKQMQQQRGLKNLSAVEGIQQRIEAIQNSEQESKAKVLQFARQRRLQTVEQFRGLWRQVNRRFVESWKND